MKTINNFKQRSRAARSSYTLVFKSLLVCVLIVTGIQAPVQAQEEPVRFSYPSWWFGVAGGANFNFYEGTTQQLTDGLMVPAAFRKGSGVGLFAAPLIEYHRPDTRLGFMLQAGYDGRSGKFKQVFTPCDCPADLSTSLRYLTIEPSLRFAPFKSSFYLFGGPRFAFNTASSFTYQLGINPAYPDQEPTPEVNGDFSRTYKSLISMQIGAGYDIDLSSDEKQWKTILSPFISFHPYFGQDPRAIETWTLTTVRVGAALKFGRGEKIAAPAKVAEVVPEAEAQFSINSPENIPVERSMRETFPIRNYVFFDLGSTEISDRYVLLTKDQVKDFKEDRLETFTPKKLSGRSARQLTVYYNVLNILGERMQSNPSAVVRLEGSSREGEKDALAMAESVKKYLVDVFAIAPSRLNTEGRVKPRIASEQAGGTQELKLLREDDHRVTILSASPAILAQYQTGDNTFLAPVDINVVETAPIESYVTFNAPGAIDAYSSWALEVKDETGKVQNFGPYTQEVARIPGKSILGTRPKGDYKVTMVGKTKSGKTVRKEADMHMVLWTPSKDEMGQRFSVIYEFNDAASIASYEKYLTEVVTPKIPTGATVLISGYTDIIGDETYNLKLSMDRANDVKKILENSLAKAGRTDVKLQVYGFGEDEKTARYDNNYPEERFHNRGVVIDIIPKK